MMKKLKHFWKTYKMWMIIGLSFLFLSCSISLFLIFLSPSISLNGDKSLTINIHGDYFEYGATAYYQNKNVSNEITISGEVNPDVEGTYEITYTIHEGIFSNQVKRKVKVKDLESPTITLSGSKDVIICPGKEYEEEGYEAYDNADGDISDQVTIQQNKDEIIYTVQDRSGNETSVSRHLKEEDKEAPTLTLTGGESLTVLLNTTYKDQYSANDNCNGNLTNKVKVKGSVDTKTKGSYQLTYEVEDSAGNKTTKTRTVNVVPPEKGGVIYLTFDDGPKQGVTDVILDILKEESVPATFFVTNSGPDALIKREHDEGHTVALHTASHNYQKVYSSVDAYFSDLQSVHDRVYRLTGVDAKIIRFPGGSSNTVSRNYKQGIMSYLTQEVVRRGYHYFDWNVESGDAGGTKTAQGVYNNVVSHLSKSRANVVLMHDIKTYTRDALRNIIRYGKTHGYTFAAITYDTPMVTHRVNN